MTYQPGNTKGFTLVEVIVAMGVTMVLLCAVYIAVNAVQKHSAGIERKVVAQEDVKPALEIMAMEIGMVSYNPNCTTGNWRNATCSGPAANQNYRGIQEATGETITIQMDTNATCTSGGMNPACIGDTTNEIIRYEYVNAGEERYITRATGCASGQPFLGDTLTQNRPLNVRVINGDLGIAVFRYFDGSGKEMLTIDPPNASYSNLKLPGGIPYIRRILITLAVETAEKDPTTGQRKRLIYSTSVIPRNHVVKYP